MKNLLLLLLISTLVSCSYFSTANFGGPDYKSVLKDYKQDEKADYIAHLNSLAVDYVENNREAVVRLSKKSKRYLHNVYQRIVENNELLLHEGIKPKFFLVKSNTPFFFSLPVGHYFFSTGLVKKYMKHEGLWVAALSYEIVKNHNNLYPKSQIVPVGHLRTERVISLTRVPLEVRLEIHKHAYFALKRAGYDPFAYLLWIQTQNKNSLDFTLQYGDARGISREEFMFKTFLVNQKKEEVFDTEQEAEFHSSNEFYNFVNEVRRRIK